jgi:hypothetical protein
MRLSRIYFSTFRPLSDSAIFSTIYQMQIPDRLLLNFIFHRLSQGTWSFQMGFDASSSPNNHSPAFFQALSAPKISCDSAVTEPSSPVIGAPNILLFKCQNSDSSTANLCTLRSCQRRPWAIVLAESSGQIEILHLCITSVQFDR